MRILIDMDGVIADFEGDFLRRWIELHPEKSFIPLEERKGFYVKSQYPKEYHTFVEEIYHGCGFYQNLPPIPGSLEALKELQASKHDILLCTSPMLPKYENCVLEKYHWVYDRLGEHWVNNIVLTKDKTIVKGDVLIDDKPEIKGLVDPEWEHVIYDQPYNRHIEGQKRLTWQNWKEVLEIEI
jgi:5'-nucleotidase